jgi:mannitol/fructose-specific phosphotransferase system IIA component (Ntr-type)
MQVFSQLARKLMNEEFRETLAHSTNPDTLLKFLAGELNIGGNQEST